MIIVAVCFMATLTGSICGMGGGIIIKPVLDLLGIMSVETAGFLSGCTVLAMSGYSILHIKLTHTSVIESKSATVLALGAAVGGIAGRELLIGIQNRGADQAGLGTIQSIGMLILTGVCFLYSFVKHRLGSFRLTNIPMIAIVGLLLGMISSFLGIGGGPLNVTVLYLLFSMRAKTASQNSLYIILFCQVFSVVWAVIRGSVPEFRTSTLLLMAASGIGGSVVGRMANRRMDDRMVDGLLRFLMVIMIGVNLYNIFTK